MSHLHATRIEIENFKVLRSLTITPGDKRLVMITGPNASGKTSVLDAFLSCLRGKKARPDQPLRAGQAEGTVRVHLKGSGEAYEVVWSFRGEAGAIKHYLNVYDVSTGQRKAVTRPQTVLFDMASEVSIDPAAFMRADDKTRLVMMLDAIGQRKAYEENRAKYKALYEGRTETNRRAKDLERQIQTELSDPAPGEQLKPVSDEQLKAELAKAQQHNVDVAAAHSERERQIQIIAAIEEQIAQLQSKRNAAHAAKVEIENRIVGLGKPIETDAIVAKVQATREHNDRVERQRRHRLAVHELNNERQKSEGATTQLEQLDNALIALVETSQIGQAVPGLSLKNGELYHNDIPFAQVSSRQKREVSALVGIASSPRLACMMIDEADAIDDEGIKHFAEIAERYDYWFWLTGVRLGAAAVGVDAEVVTLEKQPSAAPVSSPEPPEMAEGQAASDFVDNL